MKNHPLTVLITVAAALTHLGNNCVIAQVKKLDVPAIHQEGNLWCWAASAQMIMIYLNADSNKVSQCLQVAAKSGENCCTNSTGSCDFHADWPDFVKYGFTCQTNKDEIPLTFEELKNQFDQNKPVAFSWHWEGDGGHMMVAAGYKISGGKNYVWVLDPMGKGEKFAGWRAYDFFERGGAKNYFHWNDLFDIKKKP